jgi:hypothetical protein
MVVGVPGGFTGGVLQLENSPFRKLNSLSLLPAFGADKSRIGRTCASTKNVQHFGAAH